MLKNSVKSSMERWNHSLTTGRDSSVDAAKEEWQNGNKLQDQCYIRGRMGQLMRDRGKNGK